MPPLRVHGLRSVAPQANGEFHFAILKLFQVIKIAQTFLGRNKYPALESWSEKQARAFILAQGKLEDTFWKIERVAELLDDARRKFMDFPSEVQIPVENIVNFQQANRDFPLYLDSILIYIRIFVECITELTSQLYPGKDVASRSFRDQMKWFAKQKEVDPGYADILANQTNWFITLAGNQHGQGLRDLVVHKSVRTHLFIRPGETPDKNVVHAFLYDRSGVRGADLVPAIQRMVEDLFFFLDSYVAHFVPRIEHALGSKIQEYHEPNFSLLFQFEKELPSAWLYPVLQNKPENVKGSPFENLPARSRELRGETLP